MKKFSFLGSMLLLATIVTCLFVACKKEQTTATSTDTAAVTESNIVVGVNGDGIEGLITKSDADALRSEYLKSAGKGASQYIQFSIKDLSNYIAAMKTK